MRLRGRRALSPRCLPGDARALGKVGAAHSATAGQLAYTATIQQVSILERMGAPYFEMSTLVVQLDVALGPRGCACVEAGYLRACGLRMKIRTAPYSSTRARRGCRMSW